MFVKFVYNFRVCVCVFLCDKYDETATVENIYLYVL